MLYRFYIFLIFFYSVLFSTATYSQSSKLSPTFFVLTFSPLLRILVIISLLFCLGLLFYSLLLHPRLNTSGLFLSFILFQTLCLTLVLAQQNFTPRYFTDLIYLLPLPIVVLGLSDFKRFLFASLATLSFISFYSFLQLPFLGLLNLLPILASEGWGARLSGFLGINAHASYLVVLITTLDFNLNSKRLSLPLLDLFNPFIYSLIMCLSFLCLIFTGSRAAISICLFLALIKRLPSFFAFFLSLRIRKIFLLFAPIVLAFLIYLSSLDYTQCYSCNYIFDLDRAFASISPRLSQLSYLAEFINSPTSYVLGTVDLSAPDSVGDNPWLEYTLDYGWLFTLSLFFSFLSLGSLLFKIHIFFKTYPTSPLIFIQEFLFLFFMVWFLLLF